MAGIQDVYNDIKRQLDEGEAQGINLEQSLPEIKLGIQSSFSRAELELLPQLLGNSSSTFSFLLKCLLSLGAVNQALVEKELEPFEIDEFNFVTGNLVERQMGMKLSEVLDRLIAELEVQQPNWREDLE